MQDILYAADCKQLQLLLHYPVRNRLFRLLDLRIDANFSADRK